MNVEKIRLVILKETEDGLLKNTSQGKFDSSLMGFDWETFVEQASYLSRKGYITKPQYADNTIYFYNSMLTDKGEEYLENSKWYRKVYNTVKEIKDWIK